jgi:type II secretory pathway pseudopilin PulG
MLSALRRGHLRDDAGVTVIELMVVIVLMGVIGGAVTNSVVGGMRTSRVLQERTEALSQLEITAGRMARQLRAAAPVEAVTVGANEAIQVRTFGQGTCVRHTYRVEGSQLVHYEQALSPNPPLDGVIPNPAAPAACTTPAAVLPPPSGTPRRVLVSDLSPGTIFQYRRRATPVEPLAPAPAYDGVLNFGATPRPSEREIGVIRMTLTRRVRDGGTVSFTTEVLVRNQR